MEAILRLTRSGRHTRLLVASSAQIDPSPARGDRACRSPPRETAGTPSRMIHRGVAGGLHAGRPQATEVLLRLEWRLWNPGLTAPTRRTRTTSSTLRPGT